MQAKIPYVPLLVADGSAEENIRAWWLLRTFLVRSFGILQSHLTISLSMMILVSTPPGVALLPVLAECAGATGCAPRELRDDTLVHTRYLTTALDLSRAALALLAYVVVYGILDRLQFDDPQHYIMQAGPCALLLSRWDLADGGDFTSHSLSLSLSSFLSRFLFWSVCLTRASSRFCSPSFSPK